MITIVEETNLNIVQEIELYPVLSTDKIYEITVNPLDVVEDFDLNISFETGVLTVGKEYILTCKNTHTNLCTITFNSYAGKTIIDKRDISNQELLTNELATIKIVVTNTYIILSNI